MKSVSFRFLIKLHGPSEAFLVLQVLSPRDTVAEVELVRFPVWVQMHGLPLGQATKAKVEWAASKVGEVLEVDFIPTESFGHSVH